MSSSSSGSSDLGMHFVPPAMILHCRGWGGILVLQHHQTGSNFIAFSINFYFLIYFIFIYLAHDKTGNQKLKKIMFDGKQIHFLSIIDCY